MKLLLTFLSALVAFMEINLSAADRSEGNSGNTSKCFNSVSVSENDVVVLPI